MEEPLDILVTQSRPHSDDAALDALAAAGHRLHRCHDEEAIGFPCLGALDATACPLDQPVDVAILVRRGVQPQLTPLEVGAVCAIRAGLPIVELGTDLLDPFAPWVTNRISDPADAPQACADAAERRRDPLRRAIEARIAMLLGAAGVDPSTVRVRIEGESSALHVHLDVPGPVGLRVEHALAVRVLDAVRESGRTFGHVDVSVTPMRSASPPLAMA